MRIVVLPVVFSATLLALAIFQNFKVFFRKYHLCFERKPKFRTFREILQIQWHSSLNLQPLAIFEKSIFFSKEPNFFRKKPNFESFEKFYFFSRILHHFCFFSDFRKFKLLLKDISFLLKNPKFQV